MADLAVWFINLLFILLYFGSLVYSLAQQLKTEMCVFVAASASKFNGSRGGPTCIPKLKSLGFTSSLDSFSLFNILLVTMVYTTSSRYSWTSKEQNKNKKKKIITTHEKPTSTMLFDRNSPTLTFKFFRQNTTINEQYNFLLFIVSKFFYQILKNRKWKKKKTIITTIAIK